MEEYYEIDNLSKSIGTPFYLCEEDNFIANYQNICQAFQSRYKNFILGYSYKTNYLPYLCNIVKNFGGYAEVVSRLEYDLALAVGQDPSRIIFNGPLKSFPDVELAIENNSILNIDSWYELDFVEEIAKQNPTKPVQIGLRINFNFSDEEGRSHIQSGLATGRFGFAIDEPNFSQVVSKIRQFPNIVVNCLHGHTSTSTRQVWVYEKITRTLCDLAAAYFEKTVNFIDIGGGIFGKVPEVMKSGPTPSFDDYAEAVCKIMTSHSWVKENSPYLILEPGVSIVADSLSFITKIIDIKTVNNKNFSLVDGSIYNIKPSMHSINHPFKIVKEFKDDRQIVTNFVGYTCMEKDYLLKDVACEAPEKGDFLKIYNVGAYTIVMTPPFINSAPPIVVKIGDQFKVIRARQSFDDFFKNYLIEMD